MDHLYRFTDPATVALILQLQREDLEAAMASVKAEHKTNPLSDGDFALQMQLNDLGVIETFHADRAMARSHARAVLADRTAILNEVTSEQQATRDHEIAQRLHDAPEAAAVSIPELPMSDPDCEG